MKSFIGFPDDDMGEMYDAAFEEWVMSDESAEWDATPSGESED